MSHAFTPFTNTMEHSQSRIGICPDCENAIHPRHVLITYESDGKTAQFASCPGCHTVVTPMEG
jgi:hypothetical protein